MTELAVIIKTGGKVEPADNELNKGGFAGFYIGVIEVAPPEIQVRLGPEVILYKENLIISAAVLKDYEREFEIIEGKEMIIAGSIPNTFTAKGKIKWTDELKIGDKVMLVPAQNENMYILIDKAVEL